MRENKHEWVLRVLGNLAQTNDSGGFVLREANGWIFSKTMNGERVCVLNDDDCVSVVVVVVVYGRCR